MSENPTPPTTPALKPGEYWVQCPDGSWIIARVLNWWHATNRTTAVQETEPRHDNRAF